jgi:hypothetical protein
MSFQSCGLLAGLSDKGAFSEVRKLQRRQSLEGCLDFARYDAPLTSFEMTYFGFARPVILRE